MLITVAICTFNRAESLRRTLDSLAWMQVPSDLEWELVIVNNNCRDHTDAVIKGFVGRLPIRREFEARAGQSHARNRAIDVAKGDYIVWTDDDVVVDPVWLAAYAEAFQRHSDAAVFGGPIRPRYEQPVVKWVVDSEALLGGPYCIRDLGEASLPLSSVGHRLPLGANFAVRADEQRAFRYNPELGLNPLRHRRGDEHDVIERILQSGAVGYPVPAARVEHCIGHERQTVSYLFRYFSGAGEQDAFIQQLERREHSGALFFGAPRWLWRGLFEGWLLYHLHRLASPAPVWVRHLRVFAYSLGAIRYWRREALSDRNSPTL
jgi:glycosyltransferase involved in cell wall biosynthesis